jgi:osmoprotectant transport system ATP-binding protein
MLDLKHVSKRYHNTWVVQDLNLAIHQGSCHVLIGPSGCGKSTLLRMCVGLIPPDEGTITFSGEELSAPTLTRLRLKMGYVIQVDALFPHFTAKQNATIVAKALKWPDDKLESRLKELCELTHFPERLLGNYPVQLSGGEKQRVSLIRALMLDPGILFLDEPLGSLDPITRASLQTELRELFHYLKKTVVLVTHDIWEAQFFADSITLMREGRIVQTGTVKELVDTPAESFVSEFLNAQRFGAQRGIAL